MGPIDYTSGQTATTDFLRSLQGGLQTGAAIQQVQQQQAAAQAAQAQAAQYQADAQAAMANPTPQAFSALALKYPSQREAVKQSWDGLSAADQKAEGDTMSQAYSALLAGKPEIAKQVVQSQIDARKNSGLDTSHFDNALTLLDTDPTKAQAALGFTLSHIGDPKDFAAKFGALQGEQRTADLAPAALRTANAKAAGDETDNVLKNQGVVGQVLGSLQGKGAKPAQAYTAIKSLQSRGVLSADDAATLQASVPTDPKALDDWFGQQRSAGMKPDDQQKYIAPTAGEKLQSDTTRRGQDIGAQTAAARLAFDKDQAKDEPTGPVGTPGLQGQQYLSSLDKPTADQVKALADGRLSFPVGKALQSPYWQKMITAVAQYDPAFDAVNFNARAKTRNDFVAGKSAENIKAINTAVAHMGQLNEQMTALDNSSLPAWNAAKNWAAIHIGGSDRQGRLAAADATAEGVAGEMAKVFRSTGMSEHEISAWREKFSGSTTPAQQKGTMQSAMHMLRGRMEAIQDQYRNGMGTTAAPLQILTPEAQAIFDNLLGEKKAAPAAHAHGGAPVATAPMIPAGWSVKVH